MIVEYSSNNSGGDWWLSDDDWKNLESAGWKVKWIREDEHYVKYWKCEDGRWLGALAKEATREGLSLEEAIAEWEEITGQNSEDEGCECCGRPHSFYLYKDGILV